MMIIIFKELCTLRSKKIDYFFLPNGILVGWVDRVCVYATSYTVFLIQIEGDGISRRVLVVII
jgi:hypothetical protein